MLAPSPSSPTFPAHHAETDTTSVVGQVGAQGCEDKRSRVVRTNARGLSGRQAPPTGAKAGLEIRASQSAQSHWGSSGRRPAPSPDRLPHPPPPPRLGRLPQEWEREEAFTAAACRKVRECRARAFYSVYRILRSGGGEVCPGRGPAGVGKGFCASSDVDSSSPYFPRVAGTNLSVRFREGRGPPATRLGRVTDTGSAAWAATA